MAKSTLLENLTVDELLSLREDIDVRLGKMVASEMEALEKRMAKLAKYSEAPVSKAKTTKTKKSKTKAPSTRKGKKAPAKFRDPETGNSWSGRGLTPVWLRTYEANGGKRADLAV